MPNLFFGKKGLRAGWRLAIYLGILCALGYGAVTIAGKLAHGQQAGQGDAVTLIETFALALAIALVAAWVMARIEHSSIANYGLPWRKALQGNFWTGAIVGFAALTLLLVVLKLAGFYSFGARQLHGADAALSGVLWAAAVLLAAIFEDFLYRGYLLSNLASAFGFWPSAAITSLLMAAAHIMNPGWTVLGLVTIFEYGMLACFLLRRSGSLWLPIGLHTAWNWGETYFYGIPCSGLMGQNPLLRGNFHGPSQITGMPFGVEAGWLNVILLAAIGLGFNWMPAGKTVVVKI